MNTCTHTIVRTHNTARVTLPYVPGWTPAAPKPEHQPPRHAVPSWGVVQTPFRPKPRRLPGEAAHASIDANPTSEVAYALAMSALARREGKTGAAPQSREAPKPAGLRQMQVLATLTDGEWKTSTQIAREVERNSRNITDALSRMQTLGLLDVRRRGFGPQRPFEFRITAAGRAFYANGGVV